jgi:hypothetical protein
MASHGMILSQILSERFEAAIGSRNADGAKDCIATPHSLSTCRDSISCF